MLICLGFHDLRDIHKKDTYTEDNYKKFEEAIKIINRYSRYKCGEKLFSVPELYENPRGFDNVLKIHEKIKDRLLWLLDLSAPSIGNLNINGRIWLFKRTYNSGEVDFEQWMGATRS